MVAARHGSVVWTSTSAAAPALRLPALAPALSTTTASCLPSSPPHTVPHTPRRPLPSLQYLRDETHVSLRAPVGEIQVTRAGLGNKTTAALSATSERQERAIFQRP